MISYTQSDIKCWSYNVGKLRTYALFKNRLCREPYLNVIKDKNKRIFFSNYSLSSHKLEIEIGRYRKVDINLRTCKLCKPGSIEDENHFVTECSSFSSDRN